jgi:phospholipase C
VIQRPIAPNGLLPRDPCHSHACAIQAYADGGMNGFDLVNGVEPDHLGFSRYTKDQLPAYWAYAQGFVLCDHYFTTLAGPSTPNHLATIAAQSPLFENPLCLGSCDVGQGCAATPETIGPIYNQDTCVPQGNAAPPCFDIPSVVDAFPSALTWRGYGEKTVSGANTSFHLIKSISGKPDVISSHIRLSTELESDLAAGDMPNFVHVDSVPLPWQEGPPEDPCPGEAYSVRLINVVMQGPYWNESAIIIVWDDWGGWYDHVAPAAELCGNGTFFYPGFRVPALIISPYAKAGYVLHTVVEHSSLPRLVEELFGLPFMHRRDAHARDEKAGSLLDAFDFTQAPRPPLILTPRSCQ